MAMRAKRFVLLVYREQDQCEGVMIPSVMGRFATLREAEQFKMRHYGLSENALLTED